MTSKGKAEQSNKIIRQAKTTLLETFELTDGTSQNILINHGETDV